LGGRAAAATGGYTVSMMVGATASSALVVPAAVLLGGWSAALAALAVPAALASALWLPIARRVPRAGGPRAERSPLPWRERFARLVSGFQAGNSTQFYGWLTWLAPYYEDQGWSAQRAGLLLAVWSVVQLPAGMIIPLLAERRRRWRFWALVAVGSGLLGTLGALLVPQPPVVGPWPWVMLMGIGGASFALGLSVIAWRTPDSATSAATSGLVLGVGYVCAAVAPLLMGVLIDITGGYPAAIAVLLAAGALQMWATLRIGDGPAPEPTR
jgi:CP family cyanate transporter-like MFS transporter